MIICNLNTILQERGFSVLRLSELTGISRAALTALVQNTGKGAQFDTLDTICKHLNIDLKELFSFLPIECKATAHLQNSIYYVETSEASEEDGGYLVKSNNLEFIGSLDVSIIQSGLSAESYKSPSLKIPFEAFGKLSSPNEYRVSVDLTPEGIDAYNYITLDTSIDMKFALHKIIEDSITEEFNSELYNNSINEVPPFDLDIYVYCGDTFLSVIPHDISKKTIRNLYREIYYLKAQLNNK